MSDHGTLTMTPAIEEVLAQPEVRIEGHLKVTGRARYTADFAPPGTLWAKYLGSPVAHARIVSIDTSAARQVPGVHAVLTGQDIGPRRWGKRLLDWPVLAYDRVRFIGDRVAAVAAETKEAAEEALALIKVEYEELPTVFDPLEALKPDAPILHPDAAEYKFLGGTRPPVPHPNVQGQQIVTKGDEDIEAALARADRVFEHVFTTPRQHHGFIEPHGALVWIEDDGTLRVISTNKAPFGLRQQIAAATDLPQDQIVVDNGFIGGDFGGKGTSIDEFPAYYLAKATGRPIKSIMTYVEELQASNPRHGAVMRLRTGVDKDGRFVAHHAQVWLDAGAYAGGKPSDKLILGGAFSTLGAYQVPHARYDVQTVYTNTVPGGHQRSPGEPQALFAGESHVDMIARELGMDPLEFRVLNSIRDGDTAATGDAVREVRAVELWERLRKETRWGEAAPPPNRGRGLAMGLRHVGSGKTAAKMRLLPDGRVEVLHASPDQGGGDHTVAVRVAAAALGVDTARVVLRRGDTRTAPQDQGVGGSRTTHVLGRVTIDCAVDLKAQMVDLAAEAMGWPAGKIAIEDDRFVVADGSGESAPFEDVARKIAQSGATVEASSAYDGAHGHGEPGDYNFLAYLAEVEVDPETGQVEVTGVHLVADVGTIINPVAHQGQVDGGFMHGLGFAVMEELVIEDGKVATLSLGEYKLPTQADMPPFHTTLLPTEEGPGPFGAKAAGELTNTAVAPAIANAVADAVGVRITSLPISAEKVLAALRERDGR